MDAGVTVERNEAASNGQQAEHFFFEVYQKEGTAFALRLTSLAEAEEVIVAEVKKIKDGTSQIDLTSGSIKIRKREAVYVGEGNANPHQRVPGRAIEVVKRYRITPTLTPLQEGEED